MPPEIRYLFSSKFWFKMADGVERKDIFFFNGGCCCSFEQNLSSFFLLFVVLRLKSTHNDYCIFWMALPPTPRRCRAVTFSFYLNWTSSILFSGVNFELVINHWWQHFLLFCLSCQLNVLIKFFVLCFWRRVMESPLNCVKALHLSALKGCFYFFFKLKYCIECIGNDILNETVVNLKIYLFCSWKFKTAVVQWWLCRVWDRFRDLVVKRRGQKVEYYTFILLIFFV